jgi:hypothetical protein
MSNAPLAVDPQLSITPPTPPSYALYSAGQIVGASFLGSPVAGAILFWRNAVRLGKPAGGILAVVGAIAACAIVIAVSASIGGRAGGGGGFVLAYVMGQIAKQVQGEAYAQHVAAGGKRGNIGVVIGVTLVSAAAILGLAWAIVLGDMGKKLTFGDSHVYFTAGATKDEAQHIGDYLQRAEYFKAGHTADVQLRRDDGKLTLVLVQQDGGAKSGQTMHQLEALANEINQGIAPLHVLLAIADETLDIKKRVPDASIALKEDTIIFGLDGVSAADAQKLLDALVANGLDLKRPHTYELRGDAMGLSVSVPLQLAAWDNQQVIAEYTQLAGIVGKAFGKSVRYRLCDSDWNLKRTVP